MKYALKLNDDYRILSASYTSPYTPANDVQTDELPEGNISDYRYIDGVYFYDPLPKEETESAPSDSERIDELYEALNMILNGVTE